MILRLVHRIGHRGAFLLFLALLDELYGYSILSSSGTVTVHTYPLVPYYAWGGLWVAVGVACLVGSVMQNDRWAFTAAALIKTGWALRYAYLWYLNIMSAWIAVVVWLSFAATVLVVASWPEPVTIEEREPPQIPEANGHDT